MSPPTWKICRFELSAITYQQSAVSRARLGHRERRDLESVTPLVHPYSPAKFTLADA
jgi:hypothetical protein